jgi:hypothetical protein
LWFVSLRNRLQPGATLHLLEMRYKLLYTAMLHKFCSIVNLKTREDFMKQVLAMMLTLGVAFSAGAQGKIRAARLQRPARVIVVHSPFYYNSGLGYRYGYSPFYSPYNSFGYNRFYDPFYSSRVTETLPNDVQVRIDEIDNDYSYQISNIRKDKSIAGKERRQKVRDLKHERESAILKEKRSYFEKENAVK